MFVFLFLNQQLTLPLFFAAVSAGGLASPLIASSPYAYGHGYGHGYGYSAPLSYGHSAPLAYAHSAPLAYAHHSPYSYGHGAYSHAYSAPIVKAVAPVAYAAPVVKHVVPAATSYANTYKVIVGKFVENDFQFPWDSVSLEMCNKIFSKSVRLKQNWLGNWISLQVSHSHPVVHAAPIVHAAPAYHAPLAYTAHASPIAYHGAAYHGATYHGSAIAHSAPLAYAAHSAPLAYSHGYGYGGYGGYGHGYLH